MIALKNYWSGLTERERIIAAVGGTCTLIYLFYLLIYSPLSTAVSTKTKQLIEKKETLSWMQQVRNQPKNQKQVESLTNTKLLALIGTQLSDNKFKQFPYQLQQTGPGDIQLSFDKVPYILFLSWLWTLKSHYKITIKQFTADKTDTPGLVKLLIVLTTV